MTREEEGGRLYTIITVMRGGIVRGRQTAVSGLRRTTAWDLGGHVTKLWEACRPREERFLEFDSVKVHFFYISWCGDCFISAWF